MRRAASSLSIVLALACGTSGNDGTAQTHPAATGGMVGVGGASGAAGVGAGGGAGSGGVAGKSGAGGLGGAPLACAGTMPTCGAPSCGNGVRDTCMVCTPMGGGMLGGMPDGPGGGPPGNGGACGASTETCDGADLGGAGCVEQGYATGALGCTSSCDFDRAACGACEVVSGALKSCKAGKLGEIDPDHLALVTLADDATALAWTEGPAGGGGVHCTSFGPTTQIDTAIGPFGPAGARRVALARVEGGILIAVDTPEPSIAIFFLGTGKEAPTLGATIPDARDPILGAGPTGTLLGWQDGTSTLHTALLSSTGALASTPTTLFPIVEPDFGAIVDEGGQFLVAQRGPNGVTIQRIAADGSPLSATSPVGQQTEYPTLALAGNEVRLAFADFAATPKVSLARLDPTGKLLAPPTLLATAPEQYGEVPILVDGTGTLALFTGYTGQTGVGSRVDVRRFVGGPPVVPIPVARAPHVRHAKMVRRSTDILAAWIGGDCPARIGYAAVTP